MTQIDLELPAAGKLTLGDPDPERKAKEIKVAHRLRRPMENPRLCALSERLEALRLRHDQGQLHSIQFLKELPDLAEDLVNAEKDVPPTVDEDRGKAALTALSEEVRNGETPVMVERIVADIDDIVRLVRFPGWQETHAGTREVRTALRRTLHKYQLHRDMELFEKAYGYIREYY